MTAKFIQSDNGLELSISAQNQEEIAMLSNLVLDKQYGRVKNPELVVSPVIDKLSVKSIAIHQKVFLTHELIIALGFTHVKGFSSPSLYVKKVGAYNYILLGQGTFRIWKTNATIPEGSQLVVDSSEKTISCMQGADVLFLVRYNQSVIISSLDELKRYSY